MLCTISYIGDGSGDRAIRAEDLQIARYDENGNEISKERPVRIEPSGSGADFCAVAQDGTRFYFALAFGRP